MQGLESEQCTRQSRFSTSRLADDPEDFPFTQCEADTVHRADIAFYTPEYPTSNGIPHMHIPRL